MLWLLAASNCHRAEDRNGGLPSPCQALQANPPKIKLLEYTGTPVIDTAYNDQPIAFIGPGAPYTSYEWTIGGATQRTAQQFTLIFDANTLGAVPVRLAAHRPLNTACFPHDDGIDTLTTTLVLVPWRYTSPMYGRYRGATRRNPQDTFSVRIYQGPNFDYPTNPAALPTNYAIGLPRGCVQPYREIGLAWNGVSLSLGGCTGFDGLGYLVNRDSIHLEYRTQLSSTFVDEVFLGKRIK